jgi:phycoerythrin-associated linker protein
MTFGPASQLGVSLFDETPPIEWVPGMSAEEAETIIRAVYRQVLGNAYVMESERLSVPESQFKQSNISIREFVRAVAKSDLYCSRFFTSCARYRAIELNFRHLLGRPPLDLEEMRMHSTILDTKGFEAEIDSYLNSAEYEDAFGENTVPYIRGYKTEACQSLVQFTHTFQLVRGASSSSLKGNSAGVRPRLNSNVINAVPLAVVPFAASGAGMAFASAGMGSISMPRSGSSDSSVVSIGATGNSGMATKPTSRLGVSLFDETPPIERLANSSNEDLETIIRAVYRQVLGNAYVMESERLTVPESQFKEGKLSIREFVRAIAKSDLYCSRFFTSCARYRAIELNFRHLLGRPPLDLEEMRMHSTILDTQGFEAEIDSYIDSDEYQQVFGENTVPNIRGYKTEACQSLVQFTHTFQLVRGASSSSLKGNLAGVRPRLNELVINSTPTPVVSPASDGATFREPPGSSRTIHGVVAGDKVYRVEVTGYQSKVVNRVSKFRRSNRVYLVPFDQLSQVYQKIHRENGVIASITAVN